MPKTKRTREKHRREPYDTLVGSRIEEPEPEPEPRPEPEPEPRPETIVLDKNFDEWLFGKADTIKYEKLKVALTHFRDNGLIATFTIYKEPLRYSVYIKGVNDADGAGISFDFYSHLGDWMFEIQIEDTVVTDAEGGMIDMEKKGYSRLLMAIMIYCLEQKETNLEDKLKIGIDADASGGFWEAMGMYEGGTRGFEREFQVRNWKNWLFSDTAKLKKSKSKKHKKKKTKRKKKRNSKQRRKSKMR